MSTEKTIISLNEVLGAIANWAVRQSPYICPDNLKEALELFHNQWLEKFPPEVPTFSYAWFTDYPDLYNAIKQLCDTNPFILEWNNRKNGNTAPYKFTSRYEYNNDPDDDFIDLDALVRNITNQLWGN